jgi:hypothetical protein
LDDLAGVSGEGAEVVLGHRLGRMVVVGVLLAAAAVRDEQPFQRITTLAIRFDEPIPDETFRFAPPAGEEIPPLRDEHRVEWVTLTEAQQRAPFTVLMPDTVPGN